MAESAIHRIQLGAVPQQAQESIAIRDFEVLRAVPSGADWHDCCAASFLDLPGDFGKMEVHLLLERPVADVAYRIFRAETFFGPIPEVAEAPEGGAWREACP